MSPVTLRVKLDERGERALVTGHELVAQLFRLVQLRNFLEVRPALAGHRGPDRGNIFFHQQR